MSGIESFVEKFGNVQLQCPVGGSVEQMSVAEFSELDMGKKYLGAMVTGHTTLVESGMGDEQALTIVGGAALVRDEQQGIVGLPSAEVVDAVSALEPKKKLIQNQL